MEINPGREYDMPSPEPLRPDEEIRSLRTIVDYQSSEMKKQKSKNKELLGEITMLKEELYFAKTGDLYSPNVQHILKLSDEKKELLDMLEELVRDADDKILTIDEYLALYAKAKSLIEKINKP